MRHSSAWTFRMARASSKSGQTSNALCGVVCGSVLLASVSLQQVPSRQDIRERLLSSCARLDDQGIIDSIGQLAKDPNAYRALPALFLVLEHPTARHANDEGVCRRVVPTALSGIRSIGLAQCLQLADAGKWVEWGGWTDTDWLARTPETLASLMQSSQEEIVLRAAYDYSRLDPRGARQYADSLLVSEESLHRRNGAIAAARIDRDAPTLTGLLAKSLEEKDPHVRFWAMWALGERLPWSVDAVIAALEHGDPIVREEAMSRLEVGLDPKRYLAPLPELLTGGHGGYAHARGDWKDQRLFDALGQTKAQKAISGALRDSSERVRQLALMAIAKYGTVNEAGMPALLELCNASDPVTSYWAGVASSRIQGAAWPLFRSLVHSSPTATEQRGQASEALELARRIMFEPNEFLPKADEGGYFIIPNGGTDRRFDAVSGIALATGKQLIQDAAAGSVSAIEVLNQAELVVAEHLRTLIAVATENTFEAEDACHALAKLGPVAVHAVAAAWLVESTVFAGGHGEVVMDSLGDVLSRMGPCAIPVLGFGMERARFGLRSAHYLSSQGALAALAAQSWLLAWRMPSGSDEFLGLEWGWDACPARMQFGGRGGVSAKDSESWTEVVCRRMGPECVSILKSAMNSPLAIVRERACRGLTAIAKSDSQVMTPVIAALDDEHPRVRIAAAQALLSVGQASAEILSRARHVVGEADR